MSRVEYVSPEGLRVDGRRAGEMRKLVCRMGLLDRADGSAYLEMGNTKVVAAVYGPRQVALRSRGAHDKAIVNAELTIARFATGERRKRGKGDRQSREVGALLSSTFESVVQTELFPGSQIDIYVQVIQTDGGVKTACINAASLALMDAGIPMRDFVTACSAGFLEGTPLVDLNYMEESAGGPDMPIAMYAKSGKVAMIQSDAKLPLGAFEQVLGAATQGATAVYTRLHEEVRAHSQQLLESHGAFQA